MDEQATTATVNTLFYFCNDVEPMRHFYSELVGLQETYYLNEETHGWLTYDVGGVAVVFMRHATPVPVTKEWARAPAFAGGTAPVHSWVIHLPDEAFDAATARLQAAALPSLTEGVKEGEPGHRMMVVMDPMGMTLELYATN